jgi:hypothetical protein
MESMLWERVGELADRAPRISDLRHHKLQLIAASRMRSRGEHVPAELRLAERNAAAIALSAGLLIRRIQAASDQPLIVMKGPEAAARWPSPRLRPWKDLDLLAENAEVVQAELLAAGFVEIGEPMDYADNHHLHPLAHPQLPLSVEVHRRPKWPARRTPRFDEIAEAAVPSVLGVPGVLAPSPAHHAVLMAGHAWEHDPLGRLGLLADVAATALDTDADEITAAARAWGVSRVWSATASAIDRLLLERRRASRSPIWHRHLYETRERTVFEGHVERLIGPVAAAPVTAAPIVATRALWNTLRPRPDESWSQKLQRSRRSVHHASLRESEHHQHTVGRTDT